MRLAAAVVLGLSLALGAGAARAAETWRVDPQASEIRFEYAENGKPAAGRFQRIAGTGTFDPQAPAEARLELVIDVASIDLGDARENAFVTSADWFDAATHPEARFELSALRPLGDDRYRAFGELTLKGRTRPVETELRLTVGEAARAEGELVFDRLEFGVGRGPTALFVDIGREVAVAFDLVARPAP